MINRNTIIIDTDNNQAERVLKFIRERRVNHTVLYYEPIREPDGSSNNLITGLKVILSIDCPFDCDGGETTVHIPSTYEGQKIPWKKRFKILKEVLLQILAVSVGWWRTNTFNRAPRTWMKGDRVILPVSPRHASNITHLASVASTQDIIDNLCDRYISRLEKPQCICFTEGDHTYIVNQNGIGVRLDCLETNDIPLWCYERDDIEYAKELLRLVTDSYKIYHNILLLECNKSRETNKWQIILNG